MVRSPFVEYAVECFLVMEVTVTTVDRQLRRGDCHQKGTGPSLDHLVAITRSNNDDFMTETRSGSQLRVDIGAHTPARRRIESADVDNSHASEKPGNALNLK